MKKIMAAAIAATLTAGIPASASTPDSYVPSPEIVTAQQEFADNGFGIFLHWGIYSLFGQGEWYLNYGASAEEYAKSAKAFYPADFNAAEWVKAFKDAGAKYITFTTRHHD
ncbi:alpha-L-fucosidase, partial [Paramuribaculum intestinale]